MDMTTEDRLRTLIAKDFAIPAERLTPQATLEDLEVDSLRMIEIAFAIEETFGVSIDEDTAALMGRIHTFGELCAYVSELVTSHGKAATARA
jgi:acyl carrier protein